MKTYHPGLLLDTMPDDPADDAETYFTGMAFLLSVLDVHEIAVPEISMDGALHLQGLEGLRARLSRMVDEEPIETLRERLAEVVATHSAPPSP